MTGLPFLNWLEDATGILGWSAPQFWKSSLVEYFAAVRGWNRHQQNQSGKPPIITRAELEEMESKDRIRIKRMEMHAS